MYTLSGAPFELSAFSSASGEAITHFNQPITITLTYSDTEILGDESTLKLFYWDPTWQTWLALPGGADVKNNLLVAHSDHFSIFDASTQDWQASRLPSLSAFQVADYTGAAIYRVPHLRPARSRRAAALPGPDLQHPGGGQRLWPDPGWLGGHGLVAGDRRYPPQHARHAQLSGRRHLLHRPQRRFHLLLKDTDWRIGTPPMSSSSASRQQCRRRQILLDGVGQDRQVYYFGETMTGSANRASYQAWDSCSGGIPVNQRTVDLAVVAEPGGQTLRQAAHLPLLERDQAISSICDETSPSYTDPATYPLDITYANGRYRIAFITAAGPHRLGPRLVLRRPFGPELLRARGLSEIQVQHDADGDGDFTDDL